MRRSKNCANSLADADTDTAVFSGNYADYTITSDGTTLTITDDVTTDGDDGTDRLEEIENLQFADQTISLTQTSAPTDITLSSATVNEDITDAVIGNLTVTDPDSSFEPRSPFYLSSYT